MYNIFTCHNVYIEGLMKEKMQIVLTEGLYMESSYICQEGCCVWMRILCTSYSISIRS